MPHALTIRAGSVRVKIFRSKSGEYVRHEIRWTDHHHGRHRLKRSSLGEAKREARRIADDLARGHHHAELSLADLASFRAGIVNLAGLGKTLELATAEYAECHRKLRAAGHGTLLEAVDFYLVHQPKASKRRTVAESVADFLAWKKTEISTAYHDHLRLLLKKFTAAHDPCNTADLTADQIHGWLRELPSAIGPRTRNNLLGAVQSLFSLPALRHHAARCAVGALPTFKTAPVLKRLWKPEEFRRLLHGAPSELLPVLVLGGFCKMRSSEIRRTTWEQLRLEDNQLILSVGQTKTARARVVPIPACAVAWLRTMHGTQSGLVWPHGYSTLYKQLRKLSADVGLVWHRNAMRKSACTYDELRAPGLDRNSREAGNSPGILEQNYLAVDSATRADALKWFELFPPLTNVIVPLRDKQG